MASALDVGVHQSTPGLDVGVLQSLGTSPLTKVLTDTLSLSDGITLGIGLVIPTDGFSFSDVVGITTPLTGLLVNDASWVNVLSDTQQYCVGLFPQFSDTFFFSDSVLLSLGLPDFTDTFTFSDSFQVFPGVPLVLADSFTFSDAITDTTFGDLSVNILDSTNFLPLSDALIISFNGIINISNTASGFNKDNLSLADTLNLRMAMLFPVFTDAISFSDAISVHLVIPAAVSESLSDSLSLNDAQAYFLQYAPLITDELSLSDSVNVQLYPQGESISVGDGFLFSDALNMVAIENEIIASIQDTFMFEDSVAIQSVEDFTTYIRRYLNDVTIS
jgi:hypothetical protein